MNLTCDRCGEEFEATEFRGYCEQCLGHFAGNRRRVHAAQNPAPGICADGKFLDPDECPHTVLNPVSGRSCCGLCGSEEIEAWYGLGSGHGVGSYNFCCGCDTFLDFCEDLE